MYKQDSDGVIRLRSKAEIVAAHGDSSLLMSGGYERPGEILGEFIYTPGFEPKQEPEPQQEMPKPKPGRPSKRRFFDED